MNLRPEHLRQLQRKADRHLFDALQEAAEGESLRCVMLLQATEVEGSETRLEPSLQPWNFSSPRAYRQALIAQQQQRLTHSLGETLTQLEALALRPRGGQTSRAVVVEGPVRQIVQALGLPGVQHASLDQRLDLIQPQRSHTG